MKKISKSTGLILLLSFTMLVQCSKEDSPSTTVSITSITPESGSPGTQVVIDGKNFGATVASNVVKFNGTETTVINASTTQLTVQVPAGATTGAISLQVGTNTITGPVFTVTEPTPTKPYYIKFKANGVIKIFEDTNPGFQSCGECACSFLPVLSDTRYSNISICKQENNWIVASDITGWDKTKISFSKSTFPVANFGYTENNIDYSSDYVPDQIGSEVSITKVESDGNLYGAKAYKVTGTFKCNVGQVSSVLTTTVTEGEFVIKYTEDF